MLKTKIVCTLGPATDREGVLRDMLLSGMNVARFNFSHGTYEEHKARLDGLKALREELNLPVAAMLDTKGPEIRLGKFEGGSAVIETDSDFTLESEECEGNASHAFMTYSALPKQVKPDDRILLDDGAIELVVRHTTETSVVCHVAAGGVIKNGKGVNVPNVHLDMQHLSKKDKEDLLFGIAHDIDFIAASFVRTKDDIIGMRKFVDYNGGHSIKIISKIENAEGIENFDEILKYSDGIMVARGDMGVEVNFERLPGIQKQFIKKCYQAGKMVITATQMLESMIEHPTPTRAEISDVANAVFDGTSAVMLSGETAIGKYPLRAVRAMAKIANQAEHDAFTSDIFGSIKYDIDYSDITGALCDAACTTASDIKAKAIVTLTTTGKSARRMSKFRPIQPIVAATPRIKTFHQLALSWGVYPVLALEQDTSEKLFRHAVDCAKELDLVFPGDLVVIAAGVPVATPGNTNMLKVEVVKGND